MMTLNGAHRELEKIRRHIIPPTVEIVVVWNDEIGAEDIIIKWDGKPQKIIKRDLWESI